LREAAERRYDRVKRERQKALRRQNPNVAVWSISLGVIALLLTLLYFVYPYLHYAGLAVGVLCVVVSIVETRKRDRLAWLGLAVGILAALTAITFTVLDFSGIL
jgi:uncharacterized membrane protein YkgB